MTFRPGTGLSKLIRCSIRAEEIAYAYTLRQSISGDVSMNSMGYPGPRYYSSVRREARREPYRTVAGTAAVLAFIDCPRPASGCRDAEDGRRGARRPSLKLLGDVQAGGAGRVRGCAFSGSKLAPPFPSAPPLFPRLLPVTSVSFVSLSRPETSSSRFVPRFPQGAVRASDRRNLATAPLVPSWRLTICGWRGPRGTS